MKQIGSPFDTFGGGGQDDSEPAHQHTSTPAHQHTSKPVKGTYYITAALDLDLERIRLARRAAGQMIDKSALVREAIALLAELERGGAGGN